MFEFNVGDQVTISLSGEYGVVVGRAEFSDAKPQYLLDYVAADGRYEQRWLYSSQLSNFK